MKRSHGGDSNYDSGICSKVTLVERNSNPGGITLLNTKRTAKKVENDIVQLAMEIDKADKFIHATACGKLQIIAEQIKFLKQQATRVLEETKMNTILHHVACNFVKVPGSVYHLYQRTSGQLYFSMLAPEEWSSPYSHLGSYRLENDQSWTKIEDIKEKDSELSLVNKILTFKNKANPLLALEETPMDL